MIELIFLYLLLGVLAGFIGGLLGMGGGSLLVPLLASIFLAQDFPVDEVLHYALATTMFTIVATSTASTLAHHRKNAIQWPIVGMLSLGVGVAAFLTALVIPYVKGIWLSFIFTAFILFVAAKLLLSRAEKGEKKPLNIHYRTLPLVGLVIGNISSLVSIGGGSLTVPYLLWRGMALPRAIAISAAVGLPISLAATMGYLFGAHKVDAIDYAFGYIYWPAAFTITLASVVCAPIGVSFAHRLPVDTLKKILAIFLCLISIKMLFTILFRV